MRKVEKLFICVLAIALGFPFRAGGQGTVVDKEFFRNLEQKWVVLDEIDGELAIDSDCSAPAQLLRDGQYYYLYSAVRKICVFGEEGWSLDPANSGIKPHDQDQQSINKGYGTNQLFSLPRPFEVVAGESDSFSLHLGTKNSNGKLDELVSYSFFCKTLEQAPVFPAIRLAYIVGDEADAVTKELKDSLKLETSKVKLEKLVIPAIQGPLCIRQVTVTSNGNSDFAHPFSKDDAFSDAQEIPVTISSAKDLEVVFSYDYLGTDYQWVRNQKKAFVIDIQDEEQGPFFNWKSFLIRALASLMILLSFFLLFRFILDRFRKTRRHPEGGEALDVSALLKEIESARNGLKDAGQRIGVLEEEGRVGRESLKSKEAEIVRLKGVESGLRVELENQGRTLAQTRQDLDSTKESLSQAQEQKKKLEQDLDAQKEKQELELKEQKEKLEQSFEEQSKEMKQSLLSVERHNVALRRMLLAKMSQSVNNLASRVKDRNTPDKRWEAEVRTLSSSFAQFSDKALQTLPDNVPAPLMESEWKVMDKNLQDLSLKWLKKRDSWVNTAVRFYAYLHNVELFRVMGEAGFRLSDVANLYHAMRLLFQDIDIRLEDPPRLFIDKLDSRYVQENMDHKISRLYPDYQALCVDSVIVDIQSIGFTVEGEQPVPTVIAPYFKPVA